METSKLQAVQHILVEAANQRSSTVKITVKLYKYLPTGFKTKSVIRFNDSIYLAVSRTYRL